MNEQVNISTFLELLSSDSENPLVEALRKLSDVGDPEAITEAKGKPLGSWAGWGM